MRTGTSTSVYLGMHKQTAEGGVMTIDENVDHTLWPCIPHDPAVDCETAQRMWRDPREGRVLRPFEPRNARHTTPTR